MKQVFYTGLLALSIAFGVTSCDKNDGETSNLQMTQSEVKAGLASKVTFSETGAFVSKGKSNVAGKTAAQFSHIYSSELQSLIITNDAGTQYTGSYSAGDISSLDPSEILLANGAYTATSANSLNAADDFILGYAPYSSSIDFDLSASRSIALTVVHERGFVIANSEGAIDGNRITSVVLSLEGASGDLILDSSDTHNDFYGYLFAGTYQVRINYMLNSEAAFKTGEVVIAAGIAATLAPMLDAEANPDTFRVDVGAGSSDEAAEGDQNADSDTLDSLSRVVTTTFTTSGVTGIEGAGVLENGPWTVSLDINVSASSATVTSTEAIEGINVNPSSDDDMYDYIQKEVTTTVTSTGGVDDSDSVDGEWTILLDRHSVTAGEDSSHGAPSDPVYVAREYSLYAPAFGTQIAAFTQSRSISNADGNFDPAIDAEELSREVLVSSTGGVVSTETSNEGDLANGAGRDINGDSDTLDGITRSVTSDQVYVASFNLGDHTVSTPNGAWSVTTDNAPAPVYVARAYSVWGPAFAAQQANFDQSRTISNPNGNFDPAIVAEGLSRSVVVSYDVTTEPTVGTAGIGTYSASIGGSFTVTIAALPTPEPEAAATGILTVTNVVATLGGRGNTYVISSLDGATVTAGDVITVTWGGLSDGTVHTIDITEADLADGAVTITVNQDFVESTKS